MSKKSLGDKISCRERRRGKNQKDFDEHHKPLLMGGSSFSI